jgi:hypothetical protein
MAKTVADQAESTRDATPKNGGMRGLAFTPSRSYSSWNCRGLVTEQSIRVRCGSRALLVAGVSGAGTRAIQTRWQFKADPASENKS